MATKKKGLMAENSAPTVLRVDSRFRTSGSSTDFQIELPYDVTLPEGTRAHVSAVSFPYSWWNVDTGVNDSLYVLETNGTTVWRRALALPAGQYTSLTLPALLQNTLNAGTYLSPLTYNVSYLSAQGALQIQLQGADLGQKRFRLPSEDELTDASWLAANWLPDAVPNQRDPQSVGDLLRLPSTSSFTSAMMTGLVDIGPQHTLYLHSSICNFNTLGPRPGERDVVCRIPVDVSYGYVVHYRHATIEHDTFDVGGSSLRNLSFRLTNAKGAVIDLHGGQLSLELIFVEPVLYK